MAVVDDKTALTSIANNCEVRARVDEALVAGRHRGRDRVICARGIDVEGQLRMRSQLQQRRGLLSTQYSS